jgi:hypothetical protein
MCSVDRDQGRNGISILPFDCRMRGAPEDGSRAVTAICPLSDFLAANMRMAAANCRRSGWQAHRREALADPARAP